tara:strand:- start:495 stop:2168 length:1674 start_codon:yes stop_codon:yes gene_type:complete
MERMGYTVLDVSDTTVLDELLLEQWIRANIDTFKIVGGPFAFSLGIDPLELEIDVATGRELLDQIHLLQERIGTLEGMVNPSHTHPHVDLGPISASKILAGDLAVERYIQSAGFTSGTTGFKIEGGGDAEFGNITARGQLQTVGVVQGTQSAYGGELVVASGVAILIADVAVGDESIDVKSNDLRALDNIQFQPTAARVEWMRVREAGTAITGGFRFPVDRAIAGTEQVFTAGEIGVAKGRALDKKQRSSNWGEGREGATAKWGNLGTGWGVHGVVGYHADTFPRLGNTVTADQTYSDSFLGIDRRDGVDPDDGLTAYARIGSLSGFLDYSATPAPTSQVTGFAVGASNSNYISWDSTNGLQLTNKTSGIVADDTGFIAQDQSSGSSDYIRWKDTDGTQRAHLYLSSDDSVYMMPTPGEGFVIGSLTGSTYKNWMRLEAADATYENGNSIVMYDDDGGSYTESEATGAIWTGSDSGGTWSPGDLHIGAKDNVWFATSVDGTQAVTGGFSDDKAMMLVDGVTAPATLAGYAKIYVDTADGDLKVKFGDGTVTTIAADT